MDTLASSLWAVLLLLSQSIHHEPSTESQLDDRTHFQARRMLSPRVAGVGIGIFIFFFFLALCMLICLAGSRTKAAWFYYLISTTVFAIVFLVLFASPKQSSSKPESGYDQTYIPLIVIMVLMCVGIVIAGLGLLAFQVFPTFYARPLRYNVDVMQRG